MPAELQLDQLPVPLTAAPKTFLGRWLRSGGTPAEGGGEAPESWKRVLWLTGVDYFSTLGYQPGIALLAAGALSPVSTVFLVLVTLLGAVPVYGQVARRSFAGQGSIAMLESLLSGWQGKLLVLVLLGFAVTDFVLTMTLSAADAAQHAVENPWLHPLLGDSRMAITLGLLAALGAVFLKGFRDAIRLALLIAIPYILLNLLVLLTGLVEILSEPAHFTAWRGNLAVHGDWTSTLLASAILFPKLALGMSGFETGVSVMPHVAGAPEDDVSPVPHGRVRATRKLLLTAAVIMSVMLLLSSFVTTLLIPPEAYGPGGKAAGRAIAYLAHERLGSVFGSIYDLWTIAILWFAGASAMAGLLNLIPRYLPRFGMAPHWTSYRRPLVFVLIAISVFVTWVFDAEVEAQASAYATGVLVLMLSAAFAAALALWRDFRFGRRFLRRILDLVTSGYFWIVTLVFALTLVDNVLVRPDGVIIAACFVAAVLVFGAISRYLRATELRVSEVRFADEESAQLWQGLVGKRVNLVPLRGSVLEDRLRKAEDLHAHYALTGPLAFLNVKLMDNRSEFLTPLTLKVTRAGDDFVIQASGAVAIANTIAYVSELLDPISLFLGLTGQNLMTQTLRYLLWGEGEIGFMVYKILLRYWEWTTGEEEDVRPRIYLMSE